jgi:hypothetical protein
VARVYTANCIYNMYTTINTNSIRIFAYLPKPLLHFYFPNTSPTYLSALCCFYLIVFYTFSVSIILLLSPDIMIPLNIKQKGSSNKTILLYNFSSSFTGSSRIYCSILYSSIKIAQANGNNSFATYDNSYISSLLFFTIKVLHLLIQSWPPI